jgi:predicted Rossmann-fold nucleotide-binding protein
LTLIQTKRIKGFPVILMGSEYWQGLIGWMKGTMLGNDKIESCDLEIIHIIDDPDEVVRHIKKFVIL